MSAEVASFNQAVRSAKSATNAPDSTGEVLASLTPELVIALCGPIGSPLHEVGDSLTNSLASYGYATSHIRLSTLIADNANKVGVSISKESRLKTIESLIRAGDALRAAHGNDILAKFAIARIRADRQQKFGAFKDVANESHAEDAQKISQQRVCHIIDSVKNRAELDMLRLVYGDVLVSVGVFSPLETRIENLELSGSGALEKHEIENLVDIDSGEEFSHGQSVRDTFPRCDFFLRVDEAVHGASSAASAGQITAKIHRLLNLFFKTEVITPTPEESAMYAAASAARNSACLSRQVGAAVTSATGELLAVGWNDVPQAGGGLYGKPPLAAANQFPMLEKRCFALKGKSCHNDSEKKRIAKMISEILADEKIITVDQIDAASKAISDSRVKDLIEFSRAVHAEMHAILGAGRVSGERIVGGKIYVTTYPCHSCARHIVAAGLAEVQYIEPYRKSLATKLHADALTEEVNGEHKVKLVQFDGVSPRRFIDVFEAGSRKKSGVLDLPEKKDAVPATQVSLKAIPRLEEVVIAELNLKDVVLPALSSISTENSPHG